MKAIITLGTALVGALIFSACLLVADPVQDGIPIGTYTERLVAVPVGADTTFYLRRTTNTYLERDGLSSAEAHRWATKHGYVIEW